MGLAEQMADKDVRILKAEPPVKSFHFEVDGGEPVEGYLAYETSPHIRDLAKDDPQKLSAMTAWQGKLSQIESRADLVRDSAAPLRAPTCR